MKATLTRLVVGAALLTCASSEASAKVGEERWIAYSRTAMAITGDILLSPNRLRMAGHDFPLRVVADLPDFEGDFRRGPARVLAITRPMDPKLLNGNTFGCHESIRWIVVWQYDGGKHLAMDTFTGSQMPTSVDNVTFCGSYFYFRK